MSTSTDRRHRRVVRGAWWLAFAVLLVAEVASLQLKLPVATESLVSQVLTYFIPMCAAIVAAFVLALRFNGVERRFWGLLAAAVTFVLIAEVYWTWYAIVIDFRGPRAPHWSETGHLIGLILFYVLVVSMTELGESPIFARLRFYLDVVGALILGFAVAYWVWTLPLFEALPRGGWPVAAVAALYPVCGVVMLVTTLLIVFGWKTYRWHSWERLVSAAIGIYGLGLLAFPVLYANWIAQPVQQPLDWFAIVLGFGFYLLVMAAVYRFTAGPTVEEVRAWSVPEIRPPWLPMLYPTLLAAALVIMGIASLDVAGRPGGIVIVFVTAVLALVLIIRSWLGSVELAHHRARSIADPASGAYNTRYLYERLPRDLEGATADHVQVAALAFDVVDFRDVVKMSGGEAGDRLLAELVDVIRGELPDDATVYRVGRDEFIATVSRVSASDAAALARRVNARMGSEVAIGGVPVALSAGVAVFPEHAEDAGALVSRAFAAQQLARSAERPDVIVYDAEVIEAADPLERLERARRQSHRTKLRALATAVDARDASTRFHSESVAGLASAFALVLELSEDRTTVLEMAARVHDIGKIGIGDEILLKPSPLTDDEWALVQGHPVLGERLLAPAEIPEVLPIVRHHHECWDGSGYPDGLAGTNIPIEARMLAICDSFEAMTTGRRWQPALSTAAALEEIERYSGSSFDPSLAETFSRMVVRMHGRPIAGRMTASRRDIGLASG